MIGVSLGWQITVSITLFLHKHRKALIAFSLIVGLFGMALGLITMITFA